MKTQAAVICDMNSHERFNSADSHFFRFCRICWLVLVPETFQNHRKGPEKNEFCTRLKDLLVWIQELTVEGGVRKTHLKEGERERNATAVKLTAYM